MVPTLWILASSCVKLSWVLSRGVFAGIYAIVGWARILVRLAWSSYINGIVERVIRMVCQVLESLLGSRKHILRSMYEEFVLFLRKWRSFLITGRWVQHMMTSLTSVLFHLRRCCWHLYSCSMLLTCLLACWGSNSFSPGATIVRWFLEEALSPIFAIP